MALNKSIFIACLAKLSTYEIQSSSLEFLSDVLNSGIVIGDDFHRLSCNNEIRENVEDSLRLSGTRRALDDAKLILQRIANSFILTPVASKRENGCAWTASDSGVCIYVEVGLKKGVLGDELHFLVLVCKAYGLVIVNRDDIVFSHLV